MDPRKAAARTHFRGLQDSFTDEQFSAWNRALALQLLGALKNIPPRSLVAAYRSRVREASLLPLFGMPYRFCFPLVTSPTEMEFREVVRAKEDSEFSRGAYGILEPTPAHPLVEFLETSAALVPLVAFDGSGRRLGNGKGYYDRKLAGYSGMKIGVAFEWQFSRDAIPVDAHDCALDLVITEARVRRFR